VSARVFQSDLAIPDQCRQLVEDVHTAWGRLDVLVNNAGLTRDRPLLKMTPTDWRDVMDVDLSGPFFCLQAAGRLMAAQKDGAILNVSSIIGLRGGLGCANYAAAKAGLLGLTKAAARELGRFNVRVNAVLPGFHETDMSASLPPSAKEKIRARHVLGNSSKYSSNSLCVITTFSVYATNLRGQP
jgi:3-oxoacyl-[acyl-carrier protein] reductase